MHTVGGGLALGFVATIARVGALVAAAPLFLRGAAPLRVRGLLAVAAGIVMAPILAPQTPAEFSLLGVVEIVARETLIGLILGTVVAALIAGVQTAGQIVSQMSGLALAEIVDPSSDASEPVPAQVLRHTALAVFFLIGAHRTTMQALLDSYAWAPLSVGQTLATAEAGAAATTDALSSAFLLGVRLAAPAMTAVLLAIVVTGLIARTLPQLNILSIGFTLNSAAALAALAFSLSAVPWLLDEATPVLLRQTAAHLSAAGP